jgi:two-component system alkaline phosphatase synthesis response regulator PhoP
MQKIKHNIIIIDNLNKALAQIEEYFVKEGYSVSTFYSGKDAIKKSLEINPQILILNLDLPDTDGISVCKELRKNDDLSDLIIICVGEHSANYIQMLVYESGADDYIVWPTQSELLKMRHKFLLRRRKKELLDNVSERVSVFSNLVIDKKKRLVIINNINKPFSKKEFDLLVLLSSKPEVVFPRDKIFKQIWSNSYVKNDRTIDVHIRKIREKIGENFIVTVKGVGYKFSNN